MSGIKSLLGDTPYPPPAFKGETFFYPRDYDRLSAQCKRVAEIMADGEWHRLAEISEKTRDPEASISARIRDLRAAGFNVEREYVENGLWKYRIGRII